MSNGFDTPQDVEDAFYDALEEKNLEKMGSVWEDADDIACLIPMMPMRTGFGQILEIWEPLLQGPMQVEIEVHHLHWIETGDLAIHLVEERITVAGQDKKEPPMYASNIYRKGPGGWQMILHQNSPTPPPPWMVHPGERGSSPVDR